MNLLHRLNFSLIYHHIVAACSIFNSLFFKRYVLCCQGGKEIKPIRMRAYATAYNYCPKEKGRTYRGPAFLFVHLSDSILE